MTSRVQGRFLSVVLGTYRDSESSLINQDPSRIVSRSDGQQVSPEIERLEAAIRNQSLNTLVRISSRDTSPEDVRTPTEPEYPEITKAQMDQFDSDGLTAQIDPTTGHLASQNEKIISLIDGRKFFYSGN